VTKCSALMTRSKWSLMVREACPVNCQSPLTSILSDGRQTRVAAKDIDDKVQLVIDGARRLSGRLLNSSNIYTFRQQASEIGYSTSGQRHRRNQVFVAS
jgi:hypothetical protein